MDKSSAERFGIAVRARRSELGITMEQLATACGVSRGTLSRIENNELSTSLANAVAIASALGSDLADLLTGPVFTVVRAGEATTFTDPSGITRMSLAQPAPGVELIKFTVPALASSADFAAHPHRTSETIHVLAGRLTYRAGDQSFELDAGDTLTVRADQSHGFTNTGITMCVFHLVTSTPR